MAKSKTVKPAVRKAQTGKKQQPKVPPLVQEALQVTWLLKGQLKNIQLSYLRVGALLVRVRDEKLYEALHHPDICAYAEERLSLGRASLYRYVQVYDWVRKRHKQWLEPKPQGFIPELSDATDLMEIEERLDEKDLPATTRAALEKLRAKGLEGSLRASDLKEFRRHGNAAADSGLKTALSKTRLLRKRLAEIDNMPPGVVEALDSAIALLKAAVDHKKKPAV